FDHDYDRRLHKLPQIPDRGYQAQSEKDQRIRGSLADAGDSAVAGHWLRQGIEDRALRYGQRSDVKGRRPQIGLCHGGRIRSGRGSEENGEAVCGGCGLGPSIDEIGAGRDSSRRHGAAVTLMRRRIGGPIMSLQERSNLILDFAKVLFANGQATDQTISATERVGRGLGLRVRIFPRWGEIDLQTEDADSELTSQIGADPTGVDMDRVALTIRAVEDVESGRLSADAASKTIAAIAKAPPAPTWLFALAAAAGAVALSVIFGVEHLLPAVLIFVSAGAGALLRRAVARISANVFIQPFCAALLAGVIGAIAVRYDLSSSLRLVAVCPCMVLVPGPHFLNSALDLTAGRIHLGSARLIYAGLIVLAIITGLLLGLSLLGVPLPVDPPGRSVPLWLDVIAAGVAVAAYSVFFSTPLTMLPWPVAVGMLAHALRWLALSVFG